jgi:hypothetical protein
MCLKKFSLSTKTDHFKRDKFLKSQIEDFTLAWEKQRINFIFGLGKYAKSKKKYEI